jgi:membrane protein DedA with SNARE-associated domain
MDPLAEIASFVAAYGLWGLCLLGLAERLVPVLPSYGLLLSVGIGAAEGAWSLPGAFLAVTAGGATGCVACFFAARSLGKDGAARLVKGAGRVFGISTGRLELWSEDFRRNQGGVAFAVQLVPTVRLFAPAFAAILRGDARRFIIGSTLGVAAWNGVFILAGFAAFSWTPEVNATVLAMTVLGSVLVAEAGIWWIARRRRVRLASRAVASIASEAPL